MQKPKNPWVVVWKKSTKKDKCNLALKIIKRKRFFIVPAVIFAIPMCLNIKIFLPVYFGWLMLAFLWRYLDEMVIDNQHLFDEYNKYLDASNEYWDAYWKERRACNTSDISRSYSYDSTPCSASSNSTDEINQLHILGLL